MKFGIVAVGMVVFVSTTLAAQAAVKMRVLSGGKTTAELTLPKNSTIRVSAREMQRLQTPHGTLRKVTLIGNATISVFRNNRLLMQITADEAVVETDAASTSNPDHSVIEVGTASVLLPVLGSLNDSTAVVQKFFNARSTGNEAAAWALLTARLQKALPSTEQRDNQLNLLNDRTYSAQLNPKTKALMAMSMDFGNKLGYRFRVLGSARNNPGLVVVEAYPASAPQEIATVQAVIVADPAAGGALRIDNFSTGWSNGATADPAAPRHQ